MVGKYDKWSAYGIKSRKAKTKMLNNQSRKWREKINILSNMRKQVTNVSKLEKNIKWKIRWQKFIDQAKEVWDDMRNKFISSWATGLPH